MSSAGESAGPLADLLRAMNRAKPVAEDFDHVVALNQRLARGEPGTYRPLAETLHIEHIAVEFGG